MRGEFGSLRIRLPASIVLVFAAIQFLLWGSVSVLVGNHLHVRSDRELLNVGLSILESYDALSEEEFHVAAADRFRKIVKALEPRGMYILVYLAEGDQFVRSANLRGTRLPYTPPEGGAYAPRFETLSEALARTLTRQGKLRAVTLDMESPAGYVQVVESRAAIAQLQWNLRWLMFIFLLASVIVAAIAAWLVTQKMTGPLVLITERAKALSLADGGEAIAVPRTGDEVAELATAFNVMQRRLAREYENQQSFISNAAHELRTPLAVLLASVQNEQRRTGAAQETGILASVEEEVRRLLRTVDSFLLLSRARSGRQLEVQTDVSLDDVVVSAVQSCQRKAEQYGVRVSPRLGNEPGMPEPIVRGDEDLLVTVVENLVNNAIRYAPQGTSVEVETSATSKEARVAVRDRGPGIPAAHRPRVFELFYQVDAESRKTGKAGVGLAIARAVCELHGGTVSFQDRNGGGCEFQVRLPLRNGV